METINGYEIISDRMNTSSAVYWKAKKNNKEYFLKMFNDPIRPTERIKANNLAEFKRRSNWCNRFESNRKNINSLISGLSAGNFAAPIDFFLYNNRYYEVTNWRIIEEKTINEIVLLGEEEKLLILKSAANCLRLLHDKGIIHCDIKPENLPITLTATNKNTCSLIDFDSAILEKDIPCPEEIFGTDRYWSPELMSYKMRRDYYSDNTVTVKNDVFAAAMVFHYYWSGEDFSYPQPKKGPYLHNAVLEDIPIEVSPKIPEWLKILLLKMIDKDPKQRPSMDEVLKYLKQVTLQTATKQESSFVSQEKMVEQNEEQGGGFVKGADFPDGAVSFEILPNARVKFVYGDGSKTVLSINVAAKKQFITKNNTVEVKNENRIIWFCKNCESKNYYDETKVCFCGERIDPKHEEICIYEEAEQLYNMAVTSNDFFVACEHYLKVLTYKDARQKHNECQFKAEIIRLNEKIYEDAKQHYESAEEYNSIKKWTDAIHEFTLAKQQFMKAVNFLDSNEYANICHQKIELCKSKQIYFDAKKILESATDIEDYKKAEELFSKISKFADAKENQDICLTLIKELSAKQQLEEILQEKHRAEEESDLDKKILTLQKIVSFENTVLSDDAKIIVEQNKSVLKDCLNQKTAIQVQKDLDEATRKYNDAIKSEAHPSRITNIKKILIDYKDYRQNAAFSELFENCTKSIAESKKHIDYKNALDMMCNAVTPTDFKDASKIFSHLSGFKDSDAKRDECNKKAELLERETNYNSAIEAFEKGRKITIFNWRKYK